MSHSCQSNLQHEYSETSGAMVLHAQRTIEPGEELTIRYIDTIQGKLYFLSSLYRCEHPNPGIYAFIAKSTFSYESLRNWSLDYVAHVCA